MQSVVSKNKIDPVPTISHCEPREPVMHFLQCRNFEVQTDNSALSQILTSRDMSDLYTRWYWKLAAFPGMKLVYRAGSKLYCADALSRRPVAPEDILEPFYVEQGELFVMAAQAKSPAPSRSSQRDHNQKVLNAQRSWKLCTGNCGASKVLGSPMR